ncbi:unnamed protein product [Chondrus crispus]|uniref:Uncharacterized protein n=1 Tax=Chondrus crispus TaxID=2769 RepID=R7QEQ1_CHOCR|nr:unnamed protein product [Chondrus crispus]CDF35905.1 unnamed protein product [Chondrus crispus]|eukprot:XP_005715724.1 unnamed protein product [Chondrus crispus]
MDAKRRKRPSTEPGFRGSKEIKRYKLFASVAIGQAPLHATRVGQLCACACSIVQVPSCVFIVNKPIRPTASPQTTKEF